MKNKEKYDLSKLDVIFSEAEERIDIYYLRTVPVFLVSMCVPFDETPYRTFVRWLETEESFRKT